MEKDEIPKKVFEKDKKLVLDGYLISVFDDFKIHQKNNWDFVVVVDGIEGSGKSKFARQLAYYVDPTFTGEEGLKRICFDPMDFKRTIQDDKNRGKAVIFDEAFRGLNSRSSMSSLNKDLTALLMECRQRNMFIFLVLPSFFELDHYAAVSRCICLIHIYVGEDWKRGYYSYYTPEKIKKMYGDSKSKKIFKYSEKGDFHGKFYNSFDPIDEKLYENKKSTELREMIIDPKERDTRNKSNYERRIKNFAGLVNRFVLYFRQRGYNWTQIGEIVGKTQDAIRSDAIKGIKAEKTLKKDTIKLPQGGNLESPTEGQIFLDTDEGKNLRARMGMKEYGDLEVKDTDDKETKDAEDSMP